MLKCFILILAAVLSFQSKAKAGELYKIENNKVVDKRNKVVSAHALDFFTSGVKKQKVRFEINQTVKFACERPLKSKKNSEAKIEAIREIGKKHFVKVKGCNHLVESSLISFVDVKLPQKQPSRAIAVAQRSSK